MEGVEGERNEIVAGTGDETEWIFAENPTGTKNVVGPEIIAPITRPDAFSSSPAIYAPFIPVSRGKEGRSKFWIRFTSNESKANSIRSEFSRIHDEESYDPFERKIFFHPSKKEFAISPADGRYVSIFDGRGGRGGKWNACKLFIISEETRAR